MTYTRSYSIPGPTQVSEVRRAAMHLGAEAGIDRVGVRNAALVVPELATNLAKHTAGEDVCRDGRDAHLGSEHALRQSTVKAGDPT